ncbi:NAD-dependent malic enzyme [Paenibacillus thalictri]|uniref:NAD-dependent malic enzyme n=1 Tax=Paenibacillus thalictri TaxID=2527873 RepID=A0A4Q9DHX2_9BACL|nr:NAD-dependent malic enzyme [Paenibacillus thalictri]TBL70789.1 NAD-dependent malic enzyme [Paenibacillus thalictri]
MAVGTSIIIRVELDKTAVNFGEVATAINNAGGDVIAVDVIRAGQLTTIRDITVNVSDIESQKVVNALQFMPGVKVVNTSDRTFLVHLGGKIEVQPKLPIKNRDDLSKVYTPGVARVCSAIHENKSKAYSLTIKRNMVAVVSDGSAVLGLGDIGPEASIPVMEGKAMLFKQFAGVDAFPICLDTQDTEEIIRTIKAIAPVFGGINLEDISSPRCFEIEERLTKELDIPVMHDDQHGTAIVVLAGLINSLKVVKKPIGSVRVVVNGIGAAGVAICKMLLAAGVSHLTAVDRFGAIKPGEEYENKQWQWLAEQPQLQNGGCTLSEALVGADVFIGVSRAGLLTVEHLKSMASDPIVFAMANPEPEIDPELAEPYVRILATGRSDYPNQINNVLAFPGIFSGALHCRARDINTEMKLATAHAIASVVTDEELNEQYIIPSVFNAHVVETVRREVVKAALRTGVARRVPSEFRE